MARTTGQWVEHEDGTRSWWVTVLPPEGSEEPADDEE